MIFWKVVGFTTDGKLKMYFPSNFTWECFFVYYLIIINIIIISSSSIY